MDVSPLPSQCWHNTKQDEKYKQCIQVAKLTRILYYELSVLIRHRPGLKLAAYIDQHQCDKKALSLVTNAKINLMDSLCENLQNRFVDMNSSVLHATKLVELTSWPDAHH